MNKIQKLIWQLALPYQDARDDDGHGKIVTEFAARLSKIENTNDDIVIPAAILHDIGWSQLSKKERMLIFDKSNPEQDRLKARFKHQKEGVKLAREILEKVKYPKKLIKAILEIISEHDTRDGFISDDEATMRDADKLSRFSKIGFWDDVRQSKITAEYYYSYLKEKINTPNFLYFQSSKKIALEELQKRKREIDTRSITS
ncbi:HD domain-containing protein [Patescibacteria group bacterium]